MSRTELESRFGPPKTVDVDGRTLEAWSKRFSCGLEVALVARGESPIELFASEADRGHVLFHIGLDRDQLRLPDPDPGRDGPLRWRVLRLDDNGNEFTAASVSSLCEAESLAAGFEALGHKQTYWVDEI